MTKPVVNAFSKDYVTKITIDDKDRKYKRPVINQPPKNARTVLDHRIETGTNTEKFQRISQTKI
jgi:hypothetical protein